MSADQEPEDQSQTFSRFLMGKEKRCNPTSSLRTSVLRETTSGCEESLWRPETVKWEQWTSGLFWSVLQDRGWTLWLFLEVQALFSYTSLLNWQKVQSRTQLNFFLSIHEQASLHEADRKVTDPAPVQHTAHQPLSSWIYKSVTMCQSGWALAQFNISCRSNVVQVL